MSTYFNTALTGGSSNDVRYTGPVYEGYSIQHGGGHVIEMECALEQVQITQLLAEVATIDHNTEGKLAQVTESYDIEAIMESEAPVMESAAGNVIAKVKSFLMNLWGKVKAFFASLVRTLDSMTKSTEDFVKKYKKQIENLKVAGMKYDMYDYTLQPKTDLATLYVAGDTNEHGIYKLILAKLGDAGTKGDDKLEEVENKLARYRDDKEDRLDAFRGQISGVKDASDFREELKKGFRGDKDSTEEVNVNLQTIIREVQETKKLTAIINKAQIGADKYYKDRIKMIEDIDKSINKTGGFDRGGDQKVKYSDGMAPKAASFVSIVSSEASARQAIVNAYISEWHAAVKERNNVYKKVILKAFSYKRED